MHKVKKSHGKVCKKKKCSRVLHKGDTSEQAEEAKDKKRTHRGSFSSGSLSSEFSKGD